MVTVAPAAGAAAAVAAPVNPDRRAVVVAAELAAPEMVHLRVSDARGRVVSTSPDTLAAGPVRMTWRGRRGPEGRGETVPDGRYVLEVVAAGSGLPAAPPRVVVVDRTPPRVARVHSTAAVRASRSPLVRVVVRDSASPRGIRVRLQVTETSGRPVVVGRWRAVGGPLPLPAAARAPGRRGPLLVVAEVRDAAGNTAHAAPLAVVVAPGAGHSRLVSRVITRRRAVALTVDDGYRPDALAAMLAVLERERATATFCLNGAAVAGYPSALVTRLRRAARAGRALPCEHGWSHGTGAATSHAAAWADLNRTAVGRAFGMDTAPFYRPPFGAFGPGIMSAAGGLGFRDVLLWDVDTNDWQGRTPAAITSHVLREARPGSIVLLHTLPQSATALADIIRGLRARGLEPVGVGELLSSGTPSRGGW